MPPALRFSWSIPPSLLVDPLLWVLLFAALGLLLLRGSGAARRVRRARRALWGMWLAAWVLAMPATTNWLLWRMEPRERDLGPALAGATPERTALVVLSAGMKGPPWLPRLERLNGNSMARALGASRVYGQYPGRFGVVIASGRAPGSTDTAEGMADVLVTFGVPRDRVVLESESESTRASAQNTAALLRAKGISRVVLVTSALHMRRAQAELAKVGVEVSPAPVDHLGRPLTGLDMFVPDAESFARLDPILHELLGMLKP